MSHPDRRTRPLSPAGTRLAEWLVANNKTVFEFCIDNRIEPSAVYGWLAGRTPSLKHAVTIEQATGLSAAIWVETNA